MLILKVEFGDASWHVVALVCDNSYLDADSHLQFIVGQLARMFPDIGLVYDDYMFSLLVCVKQGTMRMCPAII